MILCIENPKHATKKLLQLTNEVSKVARYKINVQNSVAFLYTNKKYQNEKLKKLSYIQLHPKE